MGYCYKGHKQEHAESMFELLLATQKKDGASVALLQLLCLQKTWLSSLEVSEEDDLFLTFGLYNLSALTVDY